MSIDQNKSALEDVLSALQDPRRRTEAAKLAEAVQRLAIHVDQIKKHLGLLADAEKPEGDKG